MNISFPDSLKKSIQERLEEKRYSNPSDYIRALVREDLVRREEKKLEQMLLDGINSGPGTTIHSKKDWGKFWEMIDVRIKDKVHKSK